MVNQIRLILINVYSRERMLGLSRALFTEYYSLGIVPIVRLSIWSVWFRTVDRLSSNFDQFGFSETYTSPSSNCGFLSTCFSEFSSLVVLSSSQIPFWVGFLSSMLIWLKSKSRLLGFKFTSIYRGFNRGDLKAPERITENVESERQKWMAKVNGESKSKVNDENRARSTYIFGVAIWFG